MRELPIRVLLFWLSLVIPGGMAAQEIVDRIVARVENDIILLSDIRALSRYQQFLDGKSETDAQILERLIDQWIVRTEANASRFPQPSDADIDRELERVQEPPPLDAARDFIQEALVQRGINDQADQWLIESKSRLHIEKFLDEAAK